MLAWLKRNKREMGCGCVELTVMSGDEEEARTYNIVWSVCVHQDRVNE